MPMPDEEGFDPNDPSTFSPGIKMKNSHTEEVCTLKERHPGGLGGLFEEGAGVGDMVYLAGLWNIVYDKELEPDEASILNFSQFADDPASLGQLLHDSNEARVAELEARTGPQGKGSLENAFDALKMIVLLEQICFHLDITDAAMLAFEGKRAEMLTGIETKYAQMLAAKEAAERQARLGGGPTSSRGGQRMVAGPGGKMIPG